MGVMTSEGGVAAVRRFYDLLEGGKFEEALQIMADDIAVRTPTDLPYGGEYHGVAGFMELMSRMTAVMDFSSVGKHFISATDPADPVVVKLKARLVSKTSGVTVDMDVVELLTVRDGRISEIDIYYKNPSAVAALWPK